MPMQPEQNQKSLTTLRPLDNLDYSMEMARKEREKFDKMWERTIFIGCLVGLLLLICTSLFRYYHILPSQKQVSPASYELKRLEYENKALKKEIAKLKKQLGDEG